MLRKIVIHLQEKWGVQEREFISRMILAGKCCISRGRGLNGEISGKYYEGLYDEEGRQPNVVLSSRGSVDTGDTILVTDNQVWSKYWKKQGGICIGMYEEGDSRYFEGAELVTDSLTELDEQILEETLLRGLGLPVTIAETGRLIIKEITKDDVEQLYRISLQEGMQYLMRDRNGDNCFEPERMRAYIENVYRYYGYGLWSVWTKQGELIGCCGLSEFERRTGRKKDYVYEDSTAQSVFDEHMEFLYRKRLLNEHLNAGDSCWNDSEQNPDEGDICLELQYMLDPKYQKKGYALEMCRAALDYGFMRTDWEEVWIRVHPDNRASIRLAEKLGFCPASADGK